MWVPTQVDSSETFCSIGPIGFIEHSSANGAGLLTTRYVVMRTCRLHANRSIHRARPATVAEPVAPTKHSLQTASDAVRSDGLHLVLAMFFAMADCAQIEARTLEPRQLSSLGVTYPRCSQADNSIANLNKRCTLQIAQSPCGMRVSISFSVQMAEKSVEQF